ncbi:Uncharacterised protein [uncultured archaeon]|nr:Uncharacterised protein [uncultured archaeon]
MTTFKHYVNREIAKMGFNEKYIKAETESQFKKGAVRHAYVTDIFTSSGSEFALADFVPFVPRGKVFYLSIESASHGRGDIVENNYALKYVEITTDSYGISRYDPSNVEVFDTTEEAESANSWVKDADLRRMLIEAARDKIPHFKKPEKLV